MRQMPEDKGVEEGPQLLPLRFLGMGLWIVWQWAMHWSTTLYVSGETPAIPFASCDLTMRVADISTMVIMALLWRRLTPLVTRRNVQAAGCLAVAVGTVGALACLNGFPVSVGLECLASICAAFGGAVLFLSWAEVYSCLAPGRMMLMGVLALVLAGSVSFVLNYLQRPLPLAGTVMAPVVSYALCWMSARFVLPRNKSDAGFDVEQAKRLRVAFPWKPVAVMAFAGFVAGFGNFTLFGQTSNTRMFATFVVGVAVFATSLISQGRVKLGHFAWAAFAISLVGLVLVAVEGLSNPVPAAFLIMLAYVALCVVGLSLLGRLSFTRGIPSLWLFGLGRASSELMMGLGSYARFVPGVEDIPQDGYALAVLSVIGIVCLILVALLWRSEDSSSSDWAVSMVEAETGKRVESQRDKLLAGCDLLAREMGLTEREREVLELLVVGQSYQQVCQALLLSMGTVKTHVRHIYGKLDVHSREEAVELARRRA